MSPWWKRHPRHPQPCERCRRVEILHDGLCVHCRRDLNAEETPGGHPARVDPSDEVVPRSPPLEPAHDRPWTHKGKI